MQTKNKLDSRDRVEDLNPDEVRTLDTFKDWTDEQIQQLIITLRTLSNIIYDNWSRKEEIGKEIDSDNNSHPDIKHAA